MSAIQAYLERTSPPNPTFLAYLANLEAVFGVSPEVARSIVQELADQRSNLKLIASENYCSLPVQYAMGNTLTDKYAEGTPGHRYYSGCDNVDDIEIQGSANEVTSTRPTLPSHGSRTLAVCWRKLFFLPRLRKPLQSFEL